MLDLSPVLFVCEGVMQISCSFHSFFLPLFAFPTKVRNKRRRRTGYCFVLDRKVISVGYTVWLAGTDYSAPKYNQGFLKAQ